MGELRRDYILDRYVVVSTGRGKRPREFKQPKPEIIEESCFFCPGHEALTPPEIGRIPGKQGWQVRWFANKFAAFAPEGNPALKTDNRFFTFASNYGNHEVIVETPDHTRQLSELTKEEIILVLQAYQNRINELTKKPGIQYASVFKNHGPQGGTSIVHSHSQVMATALLPPQVMDEVAARQKFVDCPYCAIIAGERTSSRHCFENDSFIAFCPYASRFNFEVWVFPKKHCRTIDELDLQQLADIMQKVLAKLHDLQCSYNYWLHYSPKDADLHFHIEVCPRIATWAGFEFQTGIVINSVPPEDAAKYYRGEE